MPTKCRTLTRRPLWIISSYQNNRMETLAIGPELDGGFLAAVSYEKEAEAFLWLLGDDEKERGGRVSRRRRKGWSRHPLSVVADVKGVIARLLQGPNYRGDKQMRARILGNLVRVVRPALRR